MWRLSLWMQRPSFVFAALLLLCQLTYSQNKKPVAPVFKYCQQSGQVLIVREKPDRFVIEFCDEVGLRHPSRYDIHQMYNVTSKNLEDKTVQKVWKEILEVESSDFIKALQAVPDSDDLELAVQSEESARLIAQWFRQNVMNKPNATTEIIDKSKLKFSIEDHIHTISVSRCISRGFVLASTERVETSGCRCGGKLVMSLNDYSCKNEALVPRASQSLQQKSAPASPAEPAQADL